MKKLVVWLSCVALFVSACAGTSRPTEIKVTAPASKSTVKVGQSVAIQGLVMGDAIARVDVFVNNELYASLTAPDKAKGVSNFPVTVPWTPKQVGTHGLQLRAYSPDDKVLQQSEIIILTADSATGAPIAPTTAPAAATSAAPVVATSAAPASVAGATAAPAASAQATAAAPAAPAPAAEAETPSIVVTNEFVNVRKGPGINYDAIGKLNDGEKAVARGKSADGKWWQITFGNGVGWVLGEYVKANAAAEKLQLSAAPPPPTTAPAKPQQSTGGSDLKALPTSPKP